MYGGQEEWFHAYLTLALGGVTLGRGKLAKYWLDRRLGDPDRQSSSYWDKKILSHSHAQSTSHSFCYCSKLVSSYYDKASRTFKNISFKDYKIPKGQKQISSFIFIMSANTNRKQQKGKENIFPDSGRTYNIEIKNWRKILQRN